MDNNNNNQSISERGKTDIKIPSENNELMQKALEHINQSEEIKTLWRVVNVNAMDRMGWADHGSVHVQIVSNISIRLLRILKKRGVEMSIQKNFGLSYQHAELVVMLASLFHDLGMSINRDGHEGYSLIIANNILKEVLSFLPIEERVIVASEVLHAIINHRDDGKPLTVEAGIVMIGDALDMSAGRIKLSIEEEIDLNIHAISAYAVDKVEIKEGEDRPVEIDIYMNNSSGLFQVDELLKHKINGSGIKEHFSVKAIVEGETEKKIIKEFVLK